MSVLKMFQHPFTCLVSGPTKAGKTSFVKKLIENVNFIEPTPSIIWWAYAENQSSYSEMKGVRFMQGVPDMNIIRQFEPKPQLLVLDDMMQEMKHDSNLIKLFTRGCHHWNISVIHIVQNLFFEGLRTSRINSQYLVLMKNPSDQLQVHTLARQIYPSKQKYFLEAYKDATSVPHGYLLVDLTQSTEDNLRLRTDIFNHKITVYTPKV
jgi:hypothetical protein